jgi:hypothetical protein
MLTIDLPRNREILLYLLTVRAVYEGKSPPATLEARFIPEDEIEGVDLRTHPDLGSLLWSAALEIPEALHGYVFGYDVLVDEHGTLFAAAVGMSDLLLRLGPPQPGMVLPAGQVSPEWTSIPALGGGLTKERLLEQVRQALANAAALTRRGI